MPRWKMNSLGAWEETEEYRSPNAGRVFKAPKPTETAGDKLRKEGVGEDGGYIDSGELAPDGTVLESKMFDIDPKKHKTQQKQRKIRNIAEQGATEGEQAAGKRKLKDQTQLPNISAMSTEDIEELTVKQKQLRDAQENKEFDETVAGGSLEDLRKGVDLRKKIDTAWDGARTVQNWKDPFDVVAAGTARVAEVLVPQNKEELMLEMATLGQGKKLKLGGKLFTALLDDVWSSGNSLIQRSFAAKKLAGSTGSGSIPLDNNIMMSKGSGGGGGFKQTELKLEPFQSNTYQRNTLTKMKEFGMGDGTFRMKTYDANKARFSKTNKGREMLESYLSPDRLKGSFEGYKKFNKGTWEYKWGDFLKAKGYDLKQGIQVHHINPLYDSIHLFDNVKFNSKEYWSLMDTLVKKNARTGAIQKGDDINNLMMTLGQATDEATPHGIAHKFYNNFTSDFFKKSEMKKINEVPGYRKKKAEKWATLVNKSEEIILEAHKQWSLLNPKTASQLPFDEFNSELVNRLIKLDARGYDKLIDPKYQLPDMNSIIKEIAADKGLKGPIFKTTKKSKDLSKVTQREQMTKEGDIIEELRSMKKKRKTVDPNQTKLDI